MSETFKLYRHFDCDATLLYVGVAKHLAARTAGHKAASPWGKQIASITTEEYPTKAAAHAAERAAILSEGPKFNKMKRRQAFDLDKLDRTQTPAERQQLKRDRRKAGLILLQVWVPKTKFERVAKAIDRMLSEDDGLNEVE
jgi:excinuclease UvrABC nuclease subunit